MEAVAGAHARGARERPSDAERYFFELALLHEDMHGEALLMTLQTLGLPAPPIARPRPKRASGPAATCAFAGGEFALGTRRVRAGFVFDNEKWAHPVERAPFSHRHRAW